MIEPVVLQEFQHGSEVRAIDQKTAAALAKTELVKVTPVSGGRWRLQTAGKVGSVRIGGLDVHVKPKMGISRLLFLLGYAKNPNFLPEDSPGTAEDDLWPALAESLVRYCERALARGPIRGYASVEATLPLIRGRILVADQIAARPGQSFPLEVRHDDYTADIPENRLLRTALRIMSEVPRLPDGIPGRIARLEAHLREAHFLTGTSSNAAWPLTRLNSHYGDALQIAEIVLRHQSAETGPGGLKVASFVIPVHRVFEDFVAKALREAFARFRVRVDDQVSSYLDEQRTVRIRPDVVTMLDGVPNTVVDAKYKFQDKAGTNGDVFQVVSYCTALGTTTGCLVYAHGVKEAEWQSIRNSPIRVLQYPLDLTAPPASILRSIAELVERLLART
ncbi:McrC family protein [Glycomyces paridis]|uniref:Restriction endonuclease n=1 Tax=Glycomyces paridis TaxID=2126555 RepID=A0A4V4HN32_9ACTN|nr:restriction endonuclease [Glycomyces paridis]THV24476.1 restriction endonuclease [Glycomyces paridis]